MKQLVEDMKTIENYLDSLCKKMMKWETNGIQEELNEILQPMTTVVTLLLNNKTVLEECGVALNESEVLQCLDRLINAIEMQDEIKILDSLYREYIPWLTGVKKQLIPLI